MNPMGQAGVGSYTANLMSNDPNILKPMTPQQVEEFLSQRAATFATTIASISSNLNQPLQAPPRVFIPLLLCKICRAQCQSRNGEPVCKSCRDFFRRSIQYNRIFKCPYSGTCLIDSTAMQEQCRACRMKKCRELGMVLATRVRNHTESTFKKPNLKVQESKPMPVTTIVKPQNRPKMDKKTSMRPGSNPDVQFLNIKQVTVSFLKDVLKWPKKIEMFEVLEEYLKLDLVNSQWMRLIIVTICDNGAYLLDLHEDIAYIAHSFHKMAVTSQEAHWMKACLLFMKTNPDGSYMCPDDLNDSLENLNKASLTASIEVNSPELRFGELVMLIGAIAKLSLGEIESLISPKVKDYLYLCL